jgi:hypothetical protein
MSEVRYKFAKCFNCGLKAPLTWEQVDNVSELFKDGICPNCGSKEWGVFRREPMLLATEAAGRGLLSLAGRLFRKL